jgi:hypothetical protein
MTDKRERPPSTFLPNSYSTPNDYADQFMHLLSGEEWKVLSYTVRRIFGFQKRQDRISITQYQQGTPADEGGFLDHGTGLSRPTIIKALSTLCSFGLMVFVAPNDIQFNEGDCYALQLDPSKVDVDAMLARDAERRAANSRRTSKARTLSPKTTKNTHTPGKSDLSDPGMSHLPANDLQAGQSDIPTPVSGTDQPRYVGLTHNNQGKTRGKPDTHIQLPVAAPTTTGVGGSKFSFEQRAAHADAHKLGDGWLHVSADGRYDDLIERALRRKAPDAVEQSLASPPKPRTTYREALLHVKSVLDVNPNTDLEGLVSSLDVDDGVRAQVLVKASGLRDGARASP